MAFGVREFAGETGTRMDPNILTGIMEKDGSSAHFCCIHLYNKLKLQVGHLHNRRGGELGQECTKGCHSQRTRKTCHTEVKVCSRAVIWLKFLMKRL